MLQYVIGSYSRIIKYFNHFQILLVFTKTFFFNLWTHITSRLHCTSCMLKLATTLLRGRANNALDMVHWMSEMKHWLDREMSCIALHRNKYPDHKLVNREIFNYWRKKIWSLISMLLIGHWSMMTYKHYTNDKQNSLSFPVQRGLVGL